MRQTPRSRATKKGDAVFGWFRKREQPAEAQQPIEAQPAADERAAVPAAAHEPGRPEVERGEHELAPARPSIVLAGPSLRPAMPLAPNANVAGRPDVAEAHAPRLLDPTVALGDEAREELTALLSDMFGARGRYRLEWRADREPGDDAMFSETMVADLVRRIQNTIGGVAALEAPAAPKALEAAPAAIDEASRERALDAFLKPSAEDEALAAVASPAVARADDAVRRTA